MSKHRAPKHRRQIVLPANSDPLPSGAVCTVVGSHTGKPCPRHKPKQYADQFAVHAKDGMTKGEIRNRLDSFQFEGWL